jgi:hypothetical protein
MSRRAAWRPRLKLAGPPVVYVDVVGAYRITDLSGPLLAFRVSG